MQTLMIVLALGSIPIIGMIIQIKVESYIEKPVKKEDSNG